MKLKRISAFNDMAKYVKYTQLQWAKSTNKDKISFVEAGLVRYNPNAKTYRTLEPDEFFYVRNLKPTNT